MERLAFPQTQRDDEDTEFIESPLSQGITRHGVTVQVEIYGDDEGRWILEVVDAQGASLVWDEHIETDQDALDEAIQSLEDDPIEFAGNRPEAGGVVH